MTGRPGGRRATRRVLEVLTGARRRGCHGPEELEPHEAVVEPTVEPAAEWVLRAPWVPGGGGVPVPVPA